MYLMRLFWYLREEKKTKNDSCAFFFGQEFLANFYNYSIVQIGPAKISYILFVTKIPLIVSFIKRRLKELKKVGRLSFD